MGQVSGETCLPCGPSYGCVHPHGGRFCVSPPSDRATSPIRWGPRPWPRLTPKTPYKSVSKYSLLGAKERHNSVRNRVSDAGTAPVYADARVSGPQRRGGREGAEARPVPRSHPSTSHGWFTDTRHPGTRVLPAHL